MIYRYTIIDLETSPLPLMEDGIRGMENIFRTLGIRTLSRSQASYPHPPNAYTVAWILSESHAILHTAPEKSWLEAVLATCSDKVDHRLFEDLVKGIFVPTAVRVQNVVGGLPWET